MEEEKKEPSGKKKEKKERFEISEMFMAKKGKNGWDCCYYGCIYREKDDSGKEISVNGNIYMKDEGMYWSRDTDQEKYGENIDNILEMRIDFGIHKDPGVFSTIAESRFFNN